MPNIDYQRHSFLGGEVSPSLYERADMDKFGKWFAKAENIRFGETGAFRNRCGFVKVADTKYNSAGQIIKLLSFAFNDEESFLVELGPNYARFFRNGQPIMNGDVPYELQTTYTAFTEEDIKYAQAGDTIFITHPTQGIYELARLQSDGSSWEWRKFNADILPMKEENEDENDRISATAYIQQQKYCSVVNPNSSTYNNVSFTFDSSVIYTAGSAIISEIEAGIAEQLSDDYNVSLRDNKLYIVNKTVGSSVPDFSLSFSTYGLVDYTVEDSASAMHTATSSVSYADFYSLTSFYVHGWNADSWEGFNNTKIFSANLLDNQALEANGYGKYYNELSGGSWASSDGANVNTTNKTISYTNAAAYTTARSYIKLTGKKKDTTNYLYSSQTETAGGYYTLTSTASIFNRMEVGDCILVKNYVDSQIYSGRFGTGTQEWISGASNGGWRLVCTGTWAGKGTIEYSVNNKATWTSVYEWESTEKDIPMNPNLSSAVLSDDSVFFRVKLNVTNGNININFATDAYSINSYYKILNIVNNNTAIVDCIKNDVGEISSNWQWRLPAFSNKEGWPQTVAFYQNRLFFGKDYILYGSKTDDFWDFYEPVTVKADDPISMSLLSQKVNNIRNLVTQKSFFTFTAGGEFGIGSEAALTQSDKYLKPFSSNGSAPCLPVLIGDKVLFVDKSYNSVRALQYSLESDGYEAPDITLALHSLLKDEKIISTELIYEEKEALFLSNTGTIWVLKYIPDQNVLSWSHWKHAFGKITNICVVPNGAKHVLYIAVESGSNKWIEKMDENEYMDTVEGFDATEFSKVHVTGLPGSKKYVFQGDQRYIVTVDENGDIDVPEDHTLGFKVGSSYVSTATLLTPVVQTSEYSRTNYEVKRPFKVFFYYLNSYGFKVGVKEYEKMEIEWQPIGADIDDEFNLTSGKKSVLIPSRFEGSSMVSFVQEEPYPMEVCDTLIQTDFGGK